MGKCRLWVNVSWVYVAMGICRMGICRLTEWDTFKDLRKTFVYVTSFICREGILFLCAWILYTILLSVELPKQYSEMPKQLWH